MNCPVIAFVGGQGGTKVIFGSAHTLWMSLPSDYAFRLTCLIFSDRQQFSPI